MMSALPFASCLSRSPLDNQFALCCSGCNYSYHQPTIKKGLQSNMQSNDTPPTSIPVARDAKWSVSSLLEIWHQEEKHRKVNVFSLPPLFLPWRDDLC